MDYRTLGMLELNSIAKGMEAADTMMKAASVRVLYSRPICPGKYLVIISGNIGAVTASLDAGKDIGEGFVVDELLIPNLHPEVLETIVSANGIKESSSIGVMEYFSISFAILGADAAVKSANVNLVELMLGLGIGGKSYVTLSGDIGAVKQAVEKGTREAVEQGMLLASTVIPLVSPELWENIL